MTRFTKEQMDVLAGYEDRLGTATRAQWCRAMMKRDYDTVWELWHAASGESLERNANCGSCVLHLMARVGAAYFAQKGEEETKTRTRTKTATKRSIKTR